MKKITKILLLLLSFCFALTIIACTGTSSSGSNSGSTSSTEHTCQHICPVCNKCQDSSCTDSACSNKCTCSYTSDIVEHLVSGTLHKRDVKDSTVEFIKYTDSGCSSDYSIIYDGNNSYAVKASSFISYRIYEATGVEIPTVEFDGQTYSADAHYIVLDIDSIFSQAGLTMPTDDLGTDGYYIKTVGNCAFIMNHNTEGYQMGAISFLSEVVGYDMIGEDFVIYEKDGAILPEMEILEKSDMEFRELSGVFTTSARYGMGYTDNSIMMKLSGLKWHTSFALLNPQVYYNDHKDWYSSQVTSGCTPTTNNQGQLCYTAHGTYNASTGKIEKTGSYKAMLETAFETLKEVVDNNPDLSGVTVSCQDNYDWCNCDTCKKVVEYYGANSATCILFLNDLSAMLTEYLDEQGEGRKVIIYFFAYHSTVDAPATEQADGTFKANNGIQCAENVGLVYAPIRSNFYKSYYDEENKLYADIMKAWASVSKNIGVWLYQTNFKHYFYPYNSWDVMAENLRFVKENNAVFLFYQGQMDQEEQTAFSSLKEYLTVKLGINVNSDQQALTDKFFKYYYGAGGDYMYQFYTELRLHLNMLYETYPSDVTGFIYEDIENSKFWSSELMERWLDLIDKAIEANAQYKYSNPDYYTDIINHIKLESLFPRYVLCTMFASKYDDVTIYEMRKSFKEDADSFKYDRTHESASDLSALYKSWGIS